MNTLLHNMQNNWGRVVLSAVFIIAGFFFIFYGINSIVPQYSQIEITTQSDSIRIESILENPIDAPYKILIWFIFNSGHHSLLWNRIISASLGLISCILFYLIIKMLFSRRVAIFTTILFITSSGLLHTSHLGSSLVLQSTGIVILLTILLLYLLTDRKVLFLYISSFLVALLVYSPGLILFAALGFVYIARSILTDYSKLKLIHKIMIPMLFLLILGPIILATIRDPHVGLNVLALPSRIPTTQVMLENSKNLFGSLFWEGTGPAKIMLVGAPILNTIEIALLVIGFSNLIKFSKIKNVLFILGTVLLIVALYIIGGNVQYTLLSPILYILMASGIYYLIHQWLKIFPINPFANIVGTVAILLLIAGSSFYHIRQFYFAWPHSIETNSTFSIPQPTKY